MLRQHPHHSQEIHNISSKTRNALADDKRDLPGPTILYHSIELIPVLERCAANTLIYLNAVFDTNGKASSGAQSAGKGLISWAFAVLPIYPTGLRKPCFSFQ